MNNIQTLHIQSTNTVYKTNLGIKNETVIHHNIRITIAT